MQHHTHDPSGASGGHLSLFASVGAMSFAEAYEHVRARLSAAEARAAAEQTVADAIDFLDDLDAAGADLEPDLANFRDDLEADSKSGCADSEPSLGAPERHPGLFSGDHDAYRHDQRQWATGGDTDEREEQNEDGSDEDAGEPMLGTTEAIDQSRSVTNGGFLPSCDDGEPSLGSSMCRDQTHWAEGRNDDREDEHDGREDGHDAESVNEDGSDDGDLGEHFGCGSNDGRAPPKFADKSKPNLGQAFADVAKLPDLYAMSVEGNCMAPIVSDGEYVKCDRTATILMRDIVVVWLDPRQVPPGGHQAVVKRYLGHIDRGIVLEFDNPEQTRMHCPVESILDMHKVVGKVALDEPRFRLNVAIEGEAFVTQTYTDVHLGSVL